jgi:hypothetical protein
MVVCGWSVITKKIGFEIQVGAHPTRFGIVRWVRAVLGS